MKLPITFEQFKSDPLKALFFAALGQCERVDITQPNGKKQ
jgi:hypothetical protein